MKVIINADDCGRSDIDNQLIGNFMEKGLITSTTVMATGIDLDGVRKLYDTYKEEISFGVHLNITSGKPQAYSQLLHDNGFYIEKEDGCYWGAVKYRDLRSRWLSKPIREALQQELLTQIEKVRDYGIRVSHLDSHQHVHVTMGLISVMPEVISKSGVRKMRRMFNYMPNGFNKFTRQLWGGYYLHKVNGLIMTDLFSSYGDFFKKYPHLGCNVDSTIELMCHPSINTGAYAKENELILMENPISKLDNIELINYNAL